MQQHKVLQLGIRSVLAVLVLSTTAIASTKPPTAPTLTTLAPALQPNDDGAKKLRHLRPGRARRSTYNRAEARSSMSRWLSNERSVDTKHAVQYREGYAAGYGALPLPGWGPTASDQHSLIEVVVEQYHEVARRRRGAEGYSGE